MVDSQVTVAGGAFSTDNRHLQPNLGSDEWRFQVPKVRVNKAHIHKTHYYKKEKK